MAFEKKKKKKGLQVSVDTSGPAKSISEGIEYMASKGADISKLGGKRHTVKDTGRKTYKDGKLIRSESKGIDARPESIKKFERGRDNAERFVHGESGQERVERLNKENIRFNELLAAQETPSGTSQETLRGGEEGKILKVLKDLFTGENLRGEAEQLGGRLQTGIPPMLMPAISAGAAIGGGTAVITRTATRLGKFPKTLTTQRAIVGKPAASGVNQLFAAGGRNAEIARRFATNSKSIAGTQSMIKKMGGVPTIVAAIGSYPFAGFIKEEALQTLSFGFKMAEENNDLEGMGNAIEEQKEILNPNVWESIINSIPFANIVNQLRRFYKAAGTKLESDERIFEKKSKELEGGIDNG